MLELHAFMCTRMDALSGHTLARWMGADTRHIRCL